LPSLKAEAREHTHISQTDRKKRKKGKKKEGTQERKKIRHHPIPPPKKYKNSSKGPTVPPEPAHEMVPAHPRD